MPSNIPTSTLTLRMSSSTLDPTKFFFNVASGTISIQEGPTDSFHELTSPKVIIPSLQFTKYSNPPGHDSVRVSFTVAFNTQNITQKFNRSYVTAIARVSAANFDAGIYPVAGASDLKIGTNAIPWGSINERIYFNNTLVGIGVPNPNYRLDVDVTGSYLHVIGSDVYIDSTTRGVLLKDTNNACWRLRVTTTGAATTTSVTCP